MFITPNAKIRFSKNRANYGGGIIAKLIEPDFNKTGSGLYSFCTITRSLDVGQEQIDFISNQASSGGHSIFGGRYVNCTYNCTGKGQCQILQDMNVLT